MRVDLGGGAAAGLWAGPLAAGKECAGELSLQAVAHAVARQGHAVLGAEQVQRLLGVPPLVELAPFWAELPLDDYLRDGGRYRRRRHGSYTVDAQEGVVDVPHRAHWQPLDYNALHGGIERWFAPVLPLMNAHPAYRGLLAGLGRLADACSGGARRWFVESHLFRIDTTGGIGRPTPEGAHRDGVDFVAVFLVQRSGIKGGETRVFEAEGPRGVRFTLTQPWSLLWLDDARVVHETTPIQPRQPQVLGWRDTLVVTLRRGGFQDPR